MKDPLCIDGICVDLSTIEAIIVTDSVDAKFLTSKESARTIKFFHNHRSDFDYVNYPSHQQVWALHEWLMTYMNAKKVNVSPESLVTEHARPLEPKSKA